MRKVLFSLAAVLLMLLAACGGALNKDDLDPSPYTGTDFTGEVTMTAARDAVSPKTSSLTLDIVNTTDTEFSYGAAYTLEVYLDDAWYVVPPKEDMAFIMIAYVLEPEGTAQTEVSLADAYGELPAGRYRVIKTFSSEDGNTVAAAPFAIAKE